MLKTLSSNFSISSGLTVHVPVQWRLFEGFQCGLIGRGPDLVHQAMLLKPFKKPPLDGRRCDRLPKMMPQLIEKLLYPDLSVPGPIELTKKYLLPCA